jgi:trk system potassium uptake protein TrkH
MHWRHVFKAVGVLTITLAFTMVIPLLVGLFYRDMSVRPFLQAMAATLAGGVALYLTGRTDRSEFVSQREGMAIVALGWTVARFFRCPAVLFRRGVPDPSGCRLRIRIRLYDHRGLGTH